MADDPAPDAVPASGEVAALAAEAIQESAQAQAQVEVIAEKTADAIAEVEAETEDEIAWLRNQLGEHRTMLTGLGETLTALPATIAAAISGEFQSLHQKLSKAEAIVEAGSESPAVIVESPTDGKPEPPPEKKKGIRYL